MFQKEKQKMTMEIVSLLDFNLVNITKFAYSILVHDTGVKYGHGNYQKELGNLQNDSF